MGFMAGAVDHFRPFLGPLYAWGSVMRRVWQLLLADDFSWGVPTCGLSLAHLVTVHIMVALGVPL